jgi:uncharacterized Zn finger protein
MSWYSYTSYVSVAQRRAQAAKKIQKMLKKGGSLSPIAISGRSIATTFWGKAWCKHLESLSDYENRLPRGRSYVRSGLVLDLIVDPGVITSQVLGSSLYQQTITISPLASYRWQSIKTACSGQIDSLVELLQGRLSDSVMSVLTHRDEGMFPHSSEIRMNCSCPDWAGLCKHLAAVLYGIGARLDSRPELLFTLRGADHEELLAEVTSGQAVAVTGSSDLDEASLADVFGIDIAQDFSTAESSPQEAKPTKKRALKKDSKKRKATRRRGKPLKAKSPKPVI